MQDKEEAKKKYIEQGASDTVFTTKEICKVCGISRAQLLLLEADGIIKPWKVNEASGYRYYNFFTIAEIQQYQRLRELGLSKKEIITYNNSDTEQSPTEILNKMKTRLSFYQRGVEELSLRFERERRELFSYIWLPEVTCYTRVGNFENGSQVGPFAFNVHLDAVRAGLCLLPTEPLFAMRDELFAPDAPSVTAKICIPIDPDIPKDADTSDIEVIPGGQALSLLYYGDHNSLGRMNENYIKLVDEAKARGHRVTNSYRVLGIVAPYRGMQIDPKDYVFRFAVILDQDI